MKRALVVGGGIAGLSAAYEFQQAGWMVTVHEASSRWGGKIWTSDVGTRAVDAGPDAILARAPAGIELVNDLGLDHKIVHPVSAVPAYICFNGQLHELPSGTVFGVPVSLDVLDGSGLISEAGQRRAAQDLELPVDPDLVNGDADPSVGQVCRERLGDELTDRLVAPLIGGINASDIDRLSLKAAAPQLAAALREHGSLIRGVAALRSRTGATLGTDRAAPVFFSLPGGVHTIVDALVDRLGDPVESELSPVDLQLNSTVDCALERLHDVTHLDGRSFDAAVLAVAPSTNAMAYASVSQVTVEVPTRALTAELDTSGILFPAAGGTHLTACTWLSSKWAHYRRPDTVLLRLTSGRYGDDRANRLDDDVLVDTLLSELRTVVDINDNPTAVRIKRWEHALPQYEPGHKAKVAAMRADVADRNPRVALAGAAYDGIGIPACISSGRTQARRLIDTHNSSRLTTGTR